MNIENKLFLMYKDYIINAVNYKIKILPNYPKSPLEFPTIILNEKGSIDYTNNNTVDKIEFVDSLTYRIEIYTKNMVIDGKPVASKVIMDELKGLTIEFFRKCGFQRTLCEPAEYLDVTVDRTIILEKCLTNNWNGHIM